MRSSVPSFVACLGLIVFTIFQPTAHAQLPRPNPPMPAVVAGDAAYVLEPASKVAEGTIREWTAAPSGRYLLAVQEQAGGVRNLIVYDARRNRARVVITFKPDTEVSEVSVYVEQWFGKTNTAIVAVDSTIPVPDRNAPVGSGKMYKSRRADLLLLNVASGQAKRVPLGDSDVVASPTEPYALLQVRKRSEDTLMWFGARILKPDGTISEPTMFPETPAGSDIRTAGMMWSADGTKYFLAQTDMKAEKSQVLAFDPNTKTLTPVPKFDEATVKRASRQEPSLPIRARRSTMALNERGTYAKITPIWLEAREEATQTTATATASRGKDDPRLRRTLVVADADDAILLPDLSAVLFQKQGVLYAVLLRAEKSGTYVTERRGAEKRIVLENAEKIRFKIWASLFGTNDTFPPADTDFVEFLKRGRTTEESDPTMNIATGKNGFTYLLSGQAKKEIPDPKTTVLGYLDGPGGRAVIYADLKRIEWEDDKQP